MTNMMLAELGLFLLPLIIGGGLLYNNLRDDRRLSGRFAALHEQAKGIVLTDAPQQEQSLGAVLTHALSLVGDYVLRAGLLPDQTRLDLEATLRSAGQSGSNKLRMFVGAKIMLVLVLPVAFWVGSDQAEFGFFSKLIFACTGGIFGMLVPDFVVRTLRKAHMKRVSHELPDALDMMVICAGAGLGLGTIIVRVAQELRHSHRAIAMELAHAANDLQMSTDTKGPLMSFGDRCGVDSAKRLAASLVQSAQYGTPLTEALRSLAAELRTEMITAFEARAARMPVLLTIPMIAFILPTLFLIVGGPAAIQVMHANG